MMTTAKIEVNHRVRLTRGIPDAAVAPGAIGVVCSVWQHPAPAYEVEFRGADSRVVTRAVVFEGSLERDDTTPTG